MKKLIKTKVGLTGEITLQAQDKLGKIKPLWNENKLGRLMRTVFGFDLQGNSLCGHWAEDLVLKNLVVNVGKAGAASRLNGAGAEAAFTYLAVGTGSTAPAATDTVLGYEIPAGGLARAAATCTRVTTTVTNDTAQLDYTWTSTATHAVYEAGAFNAVSAGVLLGRQTFSVVSLVSGDTLQVTYKFQCS